jgi:hypothetical protein
MLFKKLRLQTSLLFFVIASLLVLSADRSAAADAPALPATRPAATRPIPKKPKPDTADAFFGSGPLPTLYINVPPAQLKGLDSNPRTAVHAIIREVIPGHPDIIYNNVGIHLKGGPGSFRKVDEKPALNLNFDKFTPGENFHGLDKVLLNNSVQDSAYMCEYLGGFVFRSSGCPAPRVSNTRVILNGRDWGPYVIKEGFDNVFFKKYFHDTRGNLYEGNFADIDSDLPIHPGERPVAKMGPLTQEQSKAHEKEIANNRKQASTKLKKLADAARENDASKREQQLDAVLDVDHFLTFVACENIVAHWDGYSANRNNYRIYDDPRSGKLVFLPQGMDQLFQRPDFPLFASPALVARAATLSPQQRQRYYDRVKQIRDRTFNPQVMLAELDRVSTRIMPLMEEMGPDAVRQHKEQTAQLRQRLLERIANIDRQLADPPKPLKFDSDGVAKIAPWLPKLQEGDASAEPFEESGKPRLRVTAKAPGGAGSWRSTLLLPAGKYTFEGKIKTINIKPGQAPNPGAGLRISGEKARPAQLSGTHDWQLIKYNFDVTESMMEIVLVCDLNAVSGQLIIDPATLTLRKR